jgi:hypothetical protein
VREYQKLSNNFYFSKVQRIIVSDKPEAETGSLGESPLSDIKLLYTGFEGGDSLHAAHELDHHYLQELFSGITGGARDSNNLIHYAGNVSYPYTYGRKANILQRRCG